MTKSEIVDRLVPTGPNTFEIRVFCKFFASDIKVVIFSGDSDPNKIIITDYLFDCIMDLIRYGLEEKAKIVDDIFADYENTIKVTDYGMVSSELIGCHNGNIESANREYFRLNTRDDAFLALTFKYASVVEYSQRDQKRNKPRYFGLFFKRPWDTEHELQLEFENGTYKRVL